MDVNLQRYCKHYEDKLIAALESFRALAGVLKSEYGNPKKHEKPTKAYKDSTDRRQDKILEVLGDSVLPRLKATCIHALLGAGFTHGSTIPTTRLLVDLEENGYVVSHREALDGWSLKSREHDLQPYVTEQTVKEVLKRRESYISEASFESGFMKRSRLISWLGMSPSHQCQIARLLKSMVKAKLLEERNTGHQVSYRLISEDHVISV